MDHNIPDKHLEQGPFQRHQTERVNFSYQYKYKEPFTLFAYQYCKTSSPTSPTYTPHPPISTLSHGMLYKTPLPAIDSNSNQQRIEHLLETLPWDQWVLECLVLGNDTTFLHLEAPHSESQFSSEDSIPIEYIESPRDAEQQRTPVNYIVGASL